MNWIVVNVFVCILGLALLAGLPAFFGWKNTMQATKEQYANTLKELAKLDKQYTPHTNQLNKNLNTINYWLKTGKDPTESDEEAEKAEQEDRFFKGLMNPVEAKKWKDAVKKAKQEDLEDFDIKSIRVNEFDVKDMEPCDVGQTDMKFYYSDDFGENIYYCINPDAVSKRLYRHLVFFTTARTTNIPLVYPYKYEGAQMLSLYTHPAQTVWFLQNWKLIREGLESGKIEVPEIDESVTDEFDL